MPTVCNPTEEQIRHYCEQMAKDLLAARARGDDVRLGARCLSEPIHAPDYGQTLVDEIIVGGRYHAEFHSRVFSGEG